MSDRRSRAAVRKKRARKRTLALAATFTVFAVAAIAIIVQLRGGDIDKVGTPAAYAAENTPVPTVESMPAVIESEETPVPTPEAPAPTPVPAGTSGLALPVPAKTAAPPEDEPVRFTISAVGDCTLGGDMLGASEKRFYDRVSKDGVVDYDYCFKNVKDIFANDDLTIANFETVLTSSRDYLKSDKSKIFIMRARPEYAHMLTAGNIEVVNIANNHINDFGDAGIDETIAYLDGVGVDSFGRGKIVYRDVKGVTVGLVGFSTWTTTDDFIEQTMAEARANCDVLIASFHWGTELEYKATKRQQNYGRRAVDLGADLVLGHHPHVVNGIETYKGVNIVYSLGNFCFGGKENPADKDTFIYQHTFTVKNGKISYATAGIIPCSISSTDRINNYQPTPLTGKKADDIVKKIQKHSKSFKEPWEVQLINLP